VNRRNFVFGALGLLASAAIGVKARVTRAMARLRPPGALPEKEFDRACIRCFRCAEVCPVGCIRMDGFFDLKGSDTPWVDARARACILCMKCTQACPTGALQNIGADPALVQLKVRMGTPVLNKKTCLPWSHEGVCRLCYYACPYPDSAVDLSGPGQAPVFYADKCTGCGLCEEACPETARAIRILPPGAESGGAS
jgi:MauM/NapG family ferredoxin protein